MLQVAVLVVSQVAIMVVPQVAGLVVPKAVGQVIEMLAAGRSCRLGAAAGQLCIELSGMCTCAVSPSMCDRGLFVY